MCHNYTCILNVLFGINRTLLLCLACEEGTGSHCLVDSVCVCVWRGGGGGGILLLTVMFRLSKVFMTDSLKPSMHTKACKQFFVNENSCTHLKQSMPSYYVELDVELKIPIKNPAKLLSIFPLSLYHIIYTVTSVSVFVHCQDDFRHLHPQKSMFTLSC